MSGPVTVTLTYTVEEARRVAHLIDKVDRSTQLSYDDHDRLLCIASAIRLQLPQPKPAEPTGLGAVVKDREGYEWVKIDRHPACNDWRKVNPGEPDFGRARYSDIDAVEVLSEGVS